MPSTLPSWLRTLSATTGVAILATQAAGHLIYGRDPNLLLLVAGAVMVGLVSPDKLDRFLPGPNEPPPQPPAPPPVDDTESTP